jgi:hypothetical protein
MKLHDVPQRTWVVLAENEEARVPPDAPDVVTGEPIFFDHIDGMFSFCRKKDGQICHLVAWQEVEICDEQPDPR